MAQTPDEREALLDRGKDGIIFCVDLDDVEGQMAANAIAQHSPDVRRALKMRKLEDDLRYMLALAPTKGNGRAVVMLATVDSLSEAIERIHQRSMDFGELFALVVAPSDPDIVNQFMHLQSSAGTA